MPGRGFRRVDRSRLEAARREIPGEEAPAAVFGMRADVVLEGGRRGLAEPSIGEVAELFERSFESFAD